MYSVSNKSSFYLLYTSFLFLFFNDFVGLITTTARKLDREQQAEHFLEVQ